MDSVRASKKILLVETAVLTLPISIGCLGLAVVGLLVFGLAPISILMKPGSLQSTDWETVAFFSLLVIAAVLAIGAIVALAYLTIVFLRRDGWGLLGIPNKVWIVCLVASMLTLVGPISFLLQHLNVLGSASKEILGLLACFVYGMPLLIPLAHLRWEYSAARRESAMRELRN